MTVASLHSADSDNPFRPCTAGGHHNVTGLNLKGKREACSNSAGFHQVFIRCHQDDNIEFLRQCDRDDNEKISGT